MKKIIENSKLNRLFGEPFELIDNGFATGEENMKFDSERAKQYSEGTTLPMFRLYRWKPWAVSLGANQKESDINVEECQKRGFDIVRRPTGGRAILHADEITYSVVIKLHPNMTVHDIYREIHVVLLYGLRKLGCPELDFEKSQPDMREFYKKGQISVSCFASSARYEIEWQGKKVVGSAQRLFGDTLLQHGSILIGKGYEQLADVANLPDAMSRKRLNDFTLSHSTSLGEILNRQITYEECAEVIKEEIIR